MPKTVRGWLQLVGALIAAVSAALATIEGTKSE